MQTTGVEEAGRTRVSDPHGASQEYPCSIRKDVLSWFNDFLAQMKLGGFLLLLSGWGIVLAAVAMLHGNAISIFVLAGLAVEILGCILVARAHLPVREDQG